MKHRTQLLLSILSSVLHLPLSVHTRGGEKHWEYFKNVFSKNIMVAAEGVELEVLNRDSKPLSIRPRGQTIIT